MGCSQSKANEVVIESTTAPPSECGKPSMDIAFNDIIVETSTSVPPPPVEEEMSSSSEEEQKTPVQEEEITPDVEVEESVVEEPVVAAEPAVEEEETPVEPEVEVEEAPVEPEVEVEEEEAPMEPEVEAEEEVEQDKSVVEKSTVTSVNTPVWTFTAEQVVFTVGIAFFNISGSNSDGDEVHLTKRYSEFKLLHSEMTKLMDREELPSMPGTSWLQGRNDKALLEERETVFVNMLNAIAVHPEGSQSDAFNTFLV